jgi:hypothetical protein
MAAANTLAYCDMVTVTTVKSFIEPALRVKWGPCWMTPLDIKPYGRAYNEQEEKNT